MFQLLPSTNVDFMKARKIAYAFSGLLILAGLISLVLHGGPRRGIDFAGGQLLELRFNQHVQAADLRSAAGQAGFQDVEIQTLEGSNDALFRVSERAMAAGGGVLTNPATRIQEALTITYPGIQVEILRQEVVGPKVGEELRNKDALAILFSVIVIMIYIAVRFHRWEFGVAGAVSLFHTILVTLGILSMLNKEIGLTVLAAFLTIAGYSINDTIVVFDRVRENMGLKRKMSLYDLINLSINQTLSRTIVTGITVIVALFAYLYLGGDVIHDFAFTMLIGLVFGTYSSIFVASSLALDIDLNRQKRAQARHAAEKSARSGGSGARTAPSKPTVAAR
jgi:preprotein translocase subunit SecF